MLASGPRSRGCADDRCVGLHIDVRRVAGLSPSIFPSRLTGCALPPGRNQVGDRHRVGQPFMSRNLMDRPQVRIPLRRRNVPMAHHLFANRLRFAELGQERGRCVPQCVEGGAVDRAPEGEPGTFDGAPQAAPDGLDGPMPLLDDVGVGALPGVLENEPQLIA